MSAVLLELDSTLRDMIPADAGDLHIADTKGFDGNQFLQMLVDVTPLTLPWITAIVLAGIRAQKHVVIKSKGVEIRGVSADKAIEVLKQLQND